MIKNNIKNRNITTYDFHTYEPELISNGGWALDLGCNNFIFTTHLIELGLKVIAIDPIKNINIPDNLKNNPNFIFIQKACVGIKDANKKLYYEYNEFGANSLYNTPELLHRPENGGHSKNPFKEKYYVDVITIQEIMNEYSINQFEIIKIDIEGGEYEVLDNLPYKCSKQITIEFHDFLGLSPAKNIEEYHKNLPNNLKHYFLSYEQLEPLKNSESQQYQRDDSLYILNDFI
jgi:FkbM family methyltransferase